MQVHWHLIHRGLFSTSSDPPTNVLIHACAVLPESVTHYPLTSSSAFLTLHDSYSASFKIALGDILRPEQGQNDRGFHLWLSHVSWTLCGCGVSSFASSFLNAFDLPKSYDYMPDGILYVGLMIVSWRRTLLLGLARVVASTDQIPHLYVLITKIYYYGCITGQTWLEITENFVSRLSDQNTQI